MSHGSENKTAIRVGRKAPTKYCSLVKTYAKSVALEEEGGKVCWDFKVTVPTASQYSGGGAHIPVQGGGSYMMAIVSRLP